MIRAVLLEAARLLFSLACIALLAGMLLGYGSYRLLRRVSVGGPAQPVQGAAFALLTAAAALAKAVKDKETR